MHSNQPYQDATAAAAGYSHTYRTDGSGYALIYLNGPQASGGFGGDGLFVVGLDIRPGVYRTAGPVPGRLAYFALLESTNTNALVDNGVVKGPATITVGPGVKAVEVRTCQPWQRLGDNLEAVIAAAEELRSPLRRAPRP